LPSETRQSILARLGQALEGLPGIEIQFAPLRQDCYTGAILEMEDFLPGWRNAPDNEWQARILTGLESAGLPTETFGAPFGTNASAAAALGVTSFIYGPGSLEQAHTVDEWLAVDELVKAAEGYTALALACLRGK
jgi:acetylornithine deacetylase/succinyl-diaminopimelate desuccinylase-like protein